MSLLRSETRQLFAPLLPLSIILEFLVSTAMRQEKGTEGIELGKEGARRSLEGGVILHTENPRNPQNNY